MKIVGNKKNNNNKTIIIAIVAASALIALVVTLIVVLVPNNKKPDGNKGTTTTTTTTTTTKKDPTMVGISIDKLPEKVVYYVDEELDLTGLSVKVEMSEPEASYFIDAKDAELSVMGFDSSRVDDEVIVYIDYKGFRTQFNVVVCKEVEQIEGTITEILIDTTPKSIYEVGEEFDKSGIIIKVLVAESSKVYYVDGTSDELVVSGFDSSVASEALTLTVSFRGFETTYDVVVKDMASEVVVVLGLHVAINPKLTYYVGEEFDPTGMRIQVITNEQYTSYFIDAPDDRLTITGFDSSAPVDEQVITVSFEDVSTTFTVKIKEMPSAKPVLESIEVLNLRNTYSVDRWNNGGADLGGAKLKLNYTDGSSKEIDLIGDYVSPLPWADAPGTLEITITYSETNVTKSVKVPITITE